MSTPLTRLRAALPSAVAGRVTVDAADLTAVLGGATGQQRERRADRHARGLCEVCDAPHVEGRKLCRKHLADAARRMRERRKERYAAGVCAECPAPRAPDNAMCAACRTAAIAYKRGRHG